MKDNNIRKSVSIHNEVELINRSMRIINIRYIFNWSDHYHERYILSYIL